MIKLKDLLNEALWKAHGGKHIMFFGIRWRKYGDSMNQSKKENLQKESSK